MLAVRESSNDRAASLCRECLLLAVNSPGGLAPVRAGLLVSCIAASLRLLSLEIMMVHACQLLQETHCGIVQQQTQQADSLQPVCCSAGVQVVKHKLQHRHSLHWDEKPRQC